MMFEIIKKSRKFRFLLVAAFVFSLTTAAGAMEAHERDTDLAHGGSVNTAASGQAEHTPAGHDSDHQNHCTVDALCISGVWTLMGQSVAMPLTTRAAVARLLPRDAAVNGMRPRPELRPPRDDS